VSHNAFRLFKEKGTIHPQGVLQQEETDTMVSKEEGAHERQTQQESSRQLERLS
jgi:hypothetical protein